MKDLATEVDNVRGHQGVHLLSRKYSHMMDQIKQKWIIRIATAAEVHMVNTATN